MKQLTAIDGKLIGRIFFTDYKHFTNSWRYEILLLVPDDYPNPHNNTIEIIDGKHYLFIAGESGFKLESEASASAIRKIAELLNR